MKYYLSSCKFGSEAARLKQLLPLGARVGHIDNALDFSSADPARRKHHLEEEMAFLDDLGFVSEHLDLRTYFHREDDLRVKLSSVDGIWVCGGNTFVLRQAMLLSGFDNIYPALQQRRGFLWEGYSAGICVLRDSLKYIQVVDDSGDFPYEGLQEPVWDGLGLLPYGLLPHYDSDHFESTAIGLEVQRCIDNKWLFKALRDGEVMILEDL